MSVARKRDEMSNSNEISDDKANDPRNYGNLKITDRVIRIYKENQDGSKSYVRTTVLDGLMEAIYSTPKPK
jgi:hypothetical protein